MSFNTRTEVRRTRKQRCCDWCSEIIEKGAPSVTHAGYYEDFYYSRYHPECDAAIQRWWKVYGGRDEFPDYCQNRGGIEEKGEPEHYPLDVPAV